jgi:hypothetical protein
MPAFQTVYTTTELADAMAIDALLKGHGIESSIQNYNSATIDMPIPAIPFVVSVPARDAHEAAALIQEAQKNRPRRASSKRGVWIVLAVIIGLTMAAAFFLER